MEWTEVEKEDHRMGGSVVRGRGGTVWDGGDGEVGGRLRWDMGWEWGSVGRDGGGGGRIGSYTRPVRPGSVCSDCPRGIKMVTSTVSSVARPSTYQRGVGRSLTALTSHFLDLTTTCSTPCA